MLLSDHTDVQVQGTATPVVDRHAAGPTAPMPPAPRPDPLPDPQPHPQAASGTPGAPPVPARLDADDATAIALFNCLVREVSAPARQIRILDGLLVVRLVHAGIDLRVRLARPPFGPSLRLSPPIEEERPAGEKRPAGEERPTEEERPTGWAPLGWRRLADLVAGELEAATGHHNPEFTEQVAAGHAATTAILAARGEGVAEPGPGDVRATRVEPARHVRPARHVAPGAFIEAEQSLVTGHRFHPSPKARQGTPDTWLAYAPEAGARFRLRWLAIRTEFAAEEGDPGALAALEGLGPAVPDGYRALPAHPWQLSLIGARPSLRRALADRSILDLGPVGPEAVPTSSVRTVYVPDGDLFGKFSLDVRITNCVRKNSWYELSGAVLLDRLLKPVFDDLGRLFDGCVLLPEPAYRTVALADRHAYEGLGVILRGGVGGCLGVPVPAAALADPYGCSPSALVHLLAGRSPEEALAWWDAYVRLVVPPVLHAYLVHGVVLEPHLQNVLAAIDEDGIPVQAVFRDLEGTKLVDQVWTDRLRAGNAGPGSDAEHVHRALTYDAERGWKRVIYCLFVNHLTEVGAAIADLHPRLEPLLWRAAYDHITRYAAEQGGAEHGGSDDHRRTPGGRARLGALLSGQPFPAKANLRARWRRSADRHADYVTVPNPFADLDTGHASRRRERSLVSRSATNGQACGGGK